MAHEGDRNQTIRDMARERRDAAARLRECGWTLQQIGDLYGISRQRVHQLLTRWRRETEETPHV